RASPRPTDTTPMSGKARPVTVARMTCLVKESEGLRGTGAHIERGQARLLSSRLVDGGSSAARKDAPKLKLNDLFKDPGRKVKPRQTGITHVMDKGLSLAALGGLLEVAGEHVDIVKFGGATAVVSNNFEAKVKLLRERG